MVAKEPYSEEGPRELLGRMATWIGVVRVTDGSVDSGESVYIPVLEAQLNQVLSLELADSGGVVPVQQRKPDDRGIYRRPLAAVLPPPALLLDLLLTRNAP